MALRVEAGEQPVEVLGVAEVLAQDRRRVGVGDDVLVELLRSEHVVDHAAEEGDVAAGAQRDVDVGDRAGRVNRGSTWITVAPRALASITHWNPTGWHSAMFEPWITMQSAFCRSCWNVVAPPRPKLVPRPGTVAECQIRAWFSIWIAPSAVKSFLMR